MPTRILISIDTEIAWRHHAAGLSLDDMVARSIEPAGVGLTYQLAVLARHGLKACFFVDPMPALVHGIAPIARAVAAILAAGQEVQLHLHPNWYGADAGDRGQHGKFELIDHDLAEQIMLIETARGLLVEAGAPAPIAFRAGSYAANDDTLCALAALGFRFDSSHNGAHYPWPSAISLPPHQIAPVAHGGMIEIPVSLIETAGGVRHCQVTALSAGELITAVERARAAELPLLSIVSHSFELATRDGLHANELLRRRFERLCLALEQVETVHFTGLEPIRLDIEASPIQLGPLRAFARMAEQAASNLIYERRIA